MKKIEIMIGQEVTIMKITEEKDERVFTIPTKYYDDNFVELTKQKFPGCEVIVK